MRSERVQRRKTIRKNKKLTNRSKRIKRTSVKRSKKSKKSKKYKVSKKRRTFIKKSRTNKKASRRNRRMRGGLTDEQKLTIERNKAAALARKEKISGGSATGENDHWDFSPAAAPIDNWGWSKAEMTWSGPKKKDKQERVERKTFQKALNRAARKGKVAECKGVLDGEIGKFSAQEDGVKALHLAAEKGHPEVVSLLLREGVSVEDGDSALILAAGGDKQELVKLLLRYRANVDAVDGDGDSALHLAARYGHLEMVSLLLIYDANVDAANEAGATALWMAEMYGHPEVAKLLLREGAAPVVVDDQFLVKSMTRLRMGVASKSEKLGWLHADTVVTLRHRNKYQKGTHVKTAQGWTSLIDRKGNVQLEPLSQGEGAHAAARRRGGYDIDREDTATLGRRYGSTFTSKLRTQNPSPSPGGRSPEWWVDRQPLVGLLGATPPPKAEAEAEAEAAAAAADEPVVAEQAAGGTVRELRDE